MNRNELKPLETALEAEFGASPAASPGYRDGIPTFWVHREQVHGTSGVP